MNLFQFRKYFLKPENLLLDLRLFFFGKRLSFLIQRACAFQIFCLLFQLFFKLTGLFLQIGAFSLCFLQLFFCCSRLLCADCCMDLFSHFFRFALLPLQDFQPFPGLFQQFKQMIGILSVFQFHLYRIRTFFFLCIFLLLILLLCFPGLTDCFHTVQYFLLRRQLKTQQLFPDIVSFIILCNLHPFHFPPAVHAVFFQLNVQLFCLLFQCVLNLPENPCMKNF